MGGGGGGGSKEAGVGREMQNANFRPLKILSKTRTQDVM